MPVKNKFLPFSKRTLLMVNKYSEPKNLLYKDTIQNLFKINITLSIPITYIFKSLNNDKMYDNKRLWKQFYIPVRCYHLLYFFGWHSRFKKLFLNKSTIYRDYGQLKKLSQSRSTSQGLKIHNILFNFLTILKRIISTTIDYPGDFGAQ